MKAGKLPSSPLAVTHSVLVLDNVTILTLELVDLMPNRDTIAWFHRMSIERPWESRQ
jgi:hypothetical protein